MILLNFDQTKSTGILFHILEVNNWTEKKVLLCENLRSRIQSCKKLMVEFSSTTRKNQGKFGVDNNQYLRSIYFKKVNTKKNQISISLAELKRFWLTLMTESHWRLNGTKYSRMDQVKFGEDSLYPLKNLKWYGLRK